MHGGWIDGEFRDRANDGGRLDDTGIYGEGALAGSFGPFSLGIGVIPDATLRADWRYRDTPGGLDGLTSYGERTHFSEIGLLRFALGAAYQVTPRFSFGLGVGLLYNRNRLQAPYIIQTQPQLAGAKTLLDLETDGWGVNGQAGILWRPIDSVRVGLSYTLPSRLRTNGHATSDATRQLENLGLSGVDGRTHFDAEVTNEFPQTISAAVAWRIVPKLEVTVQGDWIDWANSFDTLEVRLRKTDSELYRTLLAGRSNLDDDIPLDWRDQWVLRTGVEYQLTTEFALRAGYRYARNPVPTETLTPLTAAIDEHVVTTGIGYRRGPFTVDLAYQWHLPQREHIGKTRLLGGEYRDSTVEVSIQMLTVSAGMEF
jgi:long-chain fatty acid transport protein